MVITFTIITMFRLVMSDYIEVSRLGLIFLESVFMKHRDVACNASIQAIKMQKVAIKIGMKRKKLKIMRI